MLASGSFAPVQAADLPTGVDHQRSDPALVSFSYVRNHSACPSEDEQPSTRTVTTCAVPSRRSRPASDTANSLARDPTFRRTGDNRQVIGLGGLPEFVDFIVDLGQVGGQGALADRLDVVEPLVVGIPGLKHRGDECDGFLAGDEPQPS